MASVFKPSSSAKAIGGSLKPFPSSPEQNLPQWIARKFRLWTSPFPPTSNSGDKICIVCVSDTHNTKPSLPDGDILLHAGDISQYGLFEEIQPQLDWLNSQPHKHKIAIGGNHDKILDEAFVKAHPGCVLDKPGKRREDIQWGDVKYLNNSCIEVDCNGRKVKIYGSPMTARGGTFAFQYDPNEDVWANTVPDDTDILLSHGPPALYHDVGKGCKHLLKEIWRVKPKLVVCGHIHSGRGESVITFDHLQTCFENVQLGVQPWINLFMLIVYTFLQMLSRAPTTGNVVPSTRVVNAAMVGGRGHIYRKEPITVYI